MPIETTYTHAREKFADYCDLAVNDREVVIIKRRGRRPAAIISADELSSLMETAYLLSSPRNRERLQAALDSALRGEGTVLSPDQLREEIDVKNSDNDLRMPGLAD